MNNYNWNPVFSLVMKVKHEYIDKFRNISFEQKNNKTCLELWIEKLQNQEYIDIFKYIQFNQNNNMILIRYGNYCDVFGGEEDITSEKFWAMHNGFYTECRSITIDLNLEIICLVGYQKFKNLNEGDDNQLEIITDEINNAKSIEITNKLDGSMQIARFIPEHNDVSMSGSQSIDEAQSWRLQDGYKMLNSEYRLMLEENAGLSFTFEFISMKDAHVVNYKKEQEGLYLIGIRNVYNGEQLSYKEVIKFAKWYNVLTTEIFDKSFNDVLEDVKNKKSNEMEGFVIDIEKQDGQIHKFKVKVDDYIAIHKILSKISSINLIIQSIADDKFDDMIAKVPASYISRVNKVANVVLNYIKEIDMKVKNCFDNAPKDTVKEFMLYVNNNIESNLQGYVRNLYYNNVNNYLKSGSSNQPRYKKLKEIIEIDNYTDIFEMEEVD